MENSNTGFKSLSLIDKILLIILSTAFAYGTFVSQYPSNDKTEVARIDNAPIYQKDLDGRGCILNSYSEDEVYDYLYHSMALKDADESNVYIRSADVQQAILESETFEKNGSFSEQEFEKTVQNYGDNKTFLLADIKQQVKADFFVKNYRLAGLAADAETQKLYMYSKPALTIKYSDFFLDSIEIEHTTEDLAQFYKDNLNKYLSKAARLITYVEVPYEDYSSEENLQRCYVLRREEFNVSERRSFYIVELSKSGPSIESVAKDLEQGKKLAEEIPIKEYGPYSLEEAQDALDYGNEYPLGLITKTVFLLNDNKRFTEYVERNTGVKVYVVLKDTEAPRCLSFKEACATSKMKTLLSQEEAKNIEKESRVDSMLDLYVNKQNLDLKIKNVPDRDQGSFYSSKGKLYVYKTVKTFPKRQLSFSEVISRVRDDFLTQKRTEVVKNKSYQEWAYDNKLTLSEDKLYFFSEETFYNMFYLERSKKYIMFLDNKCYVFEIEDFFSEDDKNLELYTKMEQLDYFYYLQTQKFTVRITKQKNQ